jgi:hypothetical protein
MPDEQAPAGAEQVQAKLDAAAAVGYFGTNADPVPDSVYALPHPGQGPDGQVAPENRHAAAIAYAREHGLELV